MKTLTATLVILVAVIGGYFVVQDQRHEQAASVTATQAERSKDFKECVANVRYGTAKRGSFDKQSEREMDACLHPAQ